jgi:Cu/Ag efflux pump CusA
MLMSVAKFSRTKVPMVVSQLNIRPVFDVHADVEGRDLNSAAALGVGEGGEQNAPLARAVIGGLLLATSATLILVPVLYALLRRRRASKNGSVSGAPA